MKKKFELKQEGAMRCSTQNPMLNKLSQEKLLEERSLNFT